MADVAEEQGLRAIELGKSLGPLPRVLLRASVGNGCFQVTRNESVKSPRFLQWPWTGRCFRFAASAGIG